jgi:hypothetical protein
MQVEFKKSILLLIIAGCAYLSITILLYLSVYRQLIYFAFICLALVLHGYWFMRKYILLNAKNSTQGIVVPYKLQHSLQLLSNTNTLSVQGIHSVLLSNILSILVLKTDLGNLTLFISADMLDTNQMCHLRRYICCHSKT